MFLFSAFEAGPCIMGDLVGESKFQQQPSRQFEKPLVMQSVAASMQAGAPLMQVEGDFRLVARQLRAPIGGGLSISGDVTKTNPILFVEENQYGKSAVGKDMKFFCSLHKN